jgi:hypothetical protein
MYSAPPLTLSLGLDGKGGLSIGKRKFLFPPRADLLHLLLLSGRAVAKAVQRLG